MTDDNIPGTHVPDHAIHRASMWLEDLKFGERREYATPEVVGDTWEGFLRETELPVTVEQLQEAASYYGANMARMTLGNRVNFLVPVPGGQMVDAVAIFSSLWLDAFMHGVATAQGKRGLSNEEIRRN
jgi:hypothetical protein